MSAAASSHPVRLRSGCGVTSPGSGPSPRAGHGDPLLPPASRSAKQSSWGVGGALQGTWGQGRSPGLGWGQQLTGVEWHCVWTLGSPSSPGHSDCGLARLGQRALWRVSQAPRCGSEQGIREEASSRRDVWGSWEARRLSVAVRSRHAVVASWAGPWSRRPARLCLPRPKARRGQRGPAEGLPSSARTRAHFTLGHVSLGAREAGAEGVRRARAVDLCALRAPGLPSHVPSVKREQGQAGPCLHGGAPTGSTHRGALTGSTHGEHPAPQAPALSRPV